MNQDILLDLIAAVSFALVAIGTGLIYLPLGLIVAGALGLAATIYYVRGATGSALPGAQELA